MGARGGKRGFRAYIFFCKVSMKKVEPYVAEGMYVYGTVHMHN